MVLGGARERLWVKRIDEVRQIRDDEEGSREDDSCLLGQMPAALSLF